MKCFSHYFTVVSAKYRRIDKRKVGWAFEMNSLHFLHYLVLHFSIISVTYGFMGIPSWIICLIKSILTSLVNCSSLFNCKELNLGLHACKAWVLAWSCI